jgi:hypothetical protein
MSCCKCGGHFWSRVKKTIAETGIGFRNSEMEVDSHVLNRVFHKAVHKFLNVNQSFSKYVSVWFTIKKRRNRFNIIMFTLWYV